MVAVSPRNRMMQPQSIDDLLQRLNPQQREAATHGDSPLLIVAGAGTGKTATLVHRVAWLIAHGADPGRILLLTFTRRAAAEMLRRVGELAAEFGIGGQRFNVARLWGARSTPSPRGCCGAMARRSVCRRALPSTTGPTPKT